MHAIVEELKQLIELHGWGRRFDTALQGVHSQNIRGLHAMRTLPDYLHYLDDMVCWAPCEAGDSHWVQDKLVEFYFVLDQPGLKELQSPVEPGASARGLTPLSSWIVRFANEWGSFLDTPASAERVETFRTNPKFHWDDYMPPPSGYRTFNQFFARHVKPGRRPVAGLHDQRVVCSPVDGIFVGRWPIDEGLNIHVQDEGSVNAKGLVWSIRELLSDSDHAHRFAGGTFMHSALRTFDYHRWHAPSEGQVIEARMVQGQASLDVDVQWQPRESGMPTAMLHAKEGTGFQFVQSRGLVVLATALGLVACVAIGMAQVSSVVITAESGAILHKGEEMGYFQFGGSDFVMVFERDSQIDFLCPPGTHLLQGVSLARGCPDEQRIAHLR